MDDGVDDLGLLVLLALPFPLPLTWPSSSSSSWITCSTLLDDNVSPPNVTR